MMVEGSMVDNMLPVKILYYENGQNVWSLVNPQPTVEQPSPSVVKSHDQREFLKIICSYIP